MNHYTVVFLLDPTKKKIVLLKRAAYMSFAPNRWTGVGGSVDEGESDEVGALRELKEETGLEEKDIKDFRMIARFSFKGGKDTYWENGYSIAYFEAEYDKEELQECDEGDLRWVPLDELDELDIIDDTKAALDLFKDAVFGKVISKPFEGEFLESGKGVTDTLSLKS